VSAIAGAAVAIGALSVTASVLAAAPSPRAAAPAIRAAAVGSRATASRPMAAGEMAAPAAPAATAGTADVLLSQSKLAYASSTQNAPLPQFEPWFAVDGDSFTRWASNWSDPQWLEVDLAAFDTIHKVVLDWQQAHATAFKIQISDTGQQWTTIYSTTHGTGGTEALAVNGRGRYVRMLGLHRDTPFGYSLWEFKVYGQPGPPAPGVPGPMPIPPFHPNLDPGASITVQPPVQGVSPDPGFVIPSGVTHHEFQTDCTVFLNRKDDPIVYPRMENQSAHMHSFMGALSVSSFSTTGSLSRSRTSCLTPQDHSGYWFPTLYAGNRIVDPVGPQVIYYKSGVYDYRTVRPFPKGLRFVTGNDLANAAQFQQEPGQVEGWACEGKSFYNWDFPASCPGGSQLVMRFKAPSCWDGVHLDSPNHRSHMAYPVHINGKLACPKSHPVTVPMLEFKIFFPLTGNLAPLHLHLASGAASTWHYDFFNAWDPAVQAALVRHCIDGGLQCDRYGADPYHPQAGAVLSPSYQLLHPAAAG
jgi:hypothetical protein